MNEFIEKLIGRLEEELMPLNQEITKYFYELKDTDNPKYIYAVGRSNALTDFKYTIKQLAEEYKSRIIISGQYCWQTCGATEHCKECNRLCNGNIDYYENYDFMAEEYNGGWIPCEKELPKDGVVVDLSCEYMGVLYETVGYLKDGNRGHSYIVDNDVFMRSAVLAWKKRPAPYQPKGE